MADLHRHPSVEQPLVHQAELEWSDRQELLPVVVQLGLKLQYRIPLGGTHEALVGGTILNMLNVGNGLEFARGGANRSYSGPTIFLQPGNLQPPRSFQIDLQYRF